MSYIQSAQIAPFRSRVPGPFAFVAKAAGLHKQRRALAQLTDDQLADIGVTRAEAAAESRRALWDAPLHWKG